MVFWKRSPDPRARIRERIGEYELPSFSTSAISTLSLLRADADMADIAEGLLADPGLTVRILRTVNSAGFGLRHEITNVVSAANLLGRSRLESLVLTAAVGESLPAPTGFDNEGFWQTCARRACLARRIAAATSPAMEVEAFTAGLLQDMAVPILATSDPEGYGGLYRQAGADPDVTLHEVEMDAFGYDHAEIGALMAESWSLPEGLIQAIACHHHADSDAPDAVLAVGRVRHAEPPDDLGALKAHCEGRLGLSPEDLDGMIEAASSESTSLANSMKVGAAV